MEYAIHSLSHQVKGNAKSSMNTRSFTDLFLVWFQLLDETTSSISSKAPVTLLNVWIGLISSIATVEGRWPPPWMTLKLWHFRLFVGLQKGRTKKITKIQVGSESKVKKPVHRSKPSTSRRSYEPHVQITSSCSTA